MGAPDSPRQGTAMAASAPPQPVKPGAMLRISTPSGKTASIPADLLPPFEHGRIPGSAFDRIYELGLENEQEILAELWKAYEAGVLAGQSGLGTPDLAAAGLEHGHARRVVLPQEKVPPAYWKAMPPELQERVRKLATEQEILEELNVYAAEEVQLRNVAASASMNGMAYAAVMPPNWKAKEHLTLEEFARQIGVPANAIPWTYRNHQVPPELQQRLLAPAGYSPAANRVALMDEVRGFEIEQSQRRFTVEAVRQRRRPLDQVPAAPSPVQIEIVPAAGQNRLAASRIGGSDLQLTAPAEFELKQQR